MSWIKRIFTMFQNDDDEFDDIEKVQPIQKPSKQTSNQKKDIEAKVLYQYPKGQFRFPLIPDGESAAEKPKKERTIKVSPVEEIKPFINERGSLRFKGDSLPQRDSFSKPGRESASPAQDTFVSERARKAKEPLKPAGAEESATKFRYEPRKDIGPKFRQPFKPTEIPSPIYAFNRPPRKEPEQKSHEEVEYELTGFEGAQENLGAESIQRDKDFIQKETIRQENPDSKEMPEQNQNLKDNLSETLDNAAPEDELKQFDLETETLDLILSDHSEKEIGSFIPEKETPDEGVAEKTTAENRISETNELTANVQDEVLLPEPSQAGSDPQQVYEGAEIFGHLVEDAEVIDCDQTQTEAKQGDSLLIFEEEDSQLIETKLHEAEEDKSYQKIIHPGELEDIKISEHSGESAQSTDNEPDQMEEEKQKEPKRQLPFNVLMLKQDKRKWEKRNMSKYPSFMTEGKADAPNQSREIKHETHSVAVSEDSYPEAALSEKRVLPSVAESNVSEAEPVAQKKAFTPVPNPEATSSEPGFIGQQEAPQEEVLISAPKVDSLPGIKEAVRVPEVSTEIHPAAVYEFPPLELLNPPVFKAPDPEWISEQEQMLNDTLRNFNVGARVVNVTQGPSVTRFEVQPEPGVKVNKITNLSDDIKLSLAAKDIRIEAPIPGKHTIGIEVPNHSSRPVLLSEILQTAGFMDIESPLSVALGLDIAGNPIVTDLKKMPHGLIAGATGSGKSVCINTMLVSLLYKAHPDEVKLLLIDPKMVELAPYNQIPHLVSPVITDVKAATASLKWAVEEMERRYELFAHTGVRDINRFNELAEKHRRFSHKLPYIVIVIDELADLMMMAPADVEEAICRIAQKARACGIHLIIATQRPSVDVITGLIKANVPTRIAFSVSSQVDSRTIIDISGAEKLLGRGDMLFLENGSSKPFRLQGTFVTDNEIDDIVAFVREQRAPEYLFEQEELLKKAQVTDDEDELFYEACEFVIDQGGASTSSVQRRFKIGYNRAARLIEMMEQQGFISEGRGSKPRDVLITAEDLEALQETSTFN
ncbi:DNA translocase FtsK [Mesobacillus jeotgali]|uniref:DNA translocase FtsK n=1 Tax=Mesobacillus jeotgali TaxID=129985 RepID=UPI0011172B93|nr:DNA translocase FtsK [Mesobacillus jeotgali]